MKIISLPNDLFPDKRDILDSIIFHPYIAPYGVFSGKSILNTNAISLVISGEKSIQFAEKTVNIKDDEFHFLSSGNCLVSMNISEKKIFSSIMIFFDNKTLADFYLKYDSKINRLNSKDKITKEPYINFKKDPFILNFIASLNLLLQPNASISNEMKAAKFEELMLYLLEKYPQQLLSFQTTKAYDDDFIIRKAVESNITNTIQIEELAFLCNMSVSTFKRRFTKIYGTSPSKWLLQKRMEIAKELLQHYNEKPSEVYYKVGYENHSSFTQSFKQAFGKTPKEFQSELLTVER